MLSLCLFIGSIYIRGKSAIIKQMASTSSLSCGPMRLGSIEGHLGKRNEIIYHPPKCEIPLETLIFFGGDVQDYKENMLAHRDNKYHVRWDLESTALLLHNRFPSYAVIIVKPAKMALMSFSCYENFVEVNGFGAPSYAFTIDPLKHLKYLLKNIESVVNRHRGQQTQVITMDSPAPNMSFSDCPITLVGFSKGCVVLNQFLYSFLDLKSETDVDVLSFVNRIKRMYWLDGGHSGTSSTWITDRSVLENFSQMKISVHIHVTPYQVQCDTRPRIGKEEKIFRETLSRMGSNIKRVFHFENEMRSLDMHFRVLEVFEKPV